MIGSLRGLLEECQLLAGGASELLLDVGGVGYRVLVGSRTAASLPPRGADLALRVHTHVRESAITLYGFADGDELRSFEVLLGAHGVGPALALAVLGTLGPAELAKAVATADIDTLSRVPGVGRKTATRLVVDLAQRFEGLAASLAPLAALPPAADTHQQLADALAGLGYGPDEVAAALEALPPEGSVEELLRTALAALAPAAAMLPAGTRTR